jgi:hypothetical protein
MTVTLMFIPLVAFMTRNKAMTVVMRFFTNHFLRYLFPS